MPQIDHVVLAVRDLEAAGAAFSDAGFTVTPKAEHPWGTANYRVQLRGRNFIEILAVERPDLLFEHDLETRPRQFSFGAFNRDFLADGEGMSMLVLAGEDSQADVDRFETDGLATYAPFDFVRNSELPDGSTVKLGFSLAFASLPDCPRAAFFTCHNLNPDYFWKPEFEGHANGAREIAEAVLVAEDPGRLESFATAFAAADAEAIDGGLRIPCERHYLSIVTPDAFQHRFPGTAIDLSSGPRFGAIVICGGPDNAPLDLNGLRIDWAD